MTEEQVEIAESRIYSNLTDDRPCTHEEAWEIIQNYKSALNEYLKSETRKLIKDLKG